MHPITYNPSLQGPQDLTTREKLLFSLIGLAVAGGGYLLIRKAIVKHQESSEQNKSLEDGSSATCAKQVKMAFDNDGWWGTDKDALRQVFRDIPSRNDFRRVMASYHRMYRSNLLEDMQGELKSTEYDELLSIVAAKPERPGGKDGQLTLVQLTGWAKRLKAAFDIHYGPFPGTDEPAIKAVFLEIPTQAVFEQVGKVYQQLYGNSLASDLASELEFWEYGPMMQIIQSKPKS